MSSLNKLQEIVTFSLKICMFCNFAESLPEGLKFMLVDPDESQDQQYNTGEVITFDRRSKLRRNQVLH